MEKEVDGFYAFTLRYKVHTNEIAFRIIDVGV
jgi:hypothetical protein